MEVTSSIFVLAGVTRGEFLCYITATHQKRRGGSRLGTLHHHSLCISSSVAQPTLNGGLFGEYMLGACLEHLQAVV